MNNRNSSPFLFPALTAGSFLAAWLLYFFLPGMLDIWSLQTGDYLFQLRYKYFSNRSVHSSIIHLDIDDSSIQRLPLSINDKKLYAGLIDILSEAQASAVALDMLFQKCTVPEDCLRLKDSTRNGGNVYYPLVIRTDKIHPSSQAGLQNISEYLWHPKIIDDGKPVTGSPAFVNFAGLDEVAKGIGHITSEPDRDGLFRRFPLLIRLPDGFIPSLAFRVVCDYLKVTPDRIEVFGRKIVLRDAEFPDGRIKNITIPVDDHGRIIINFAGPWDNSFPHYSVADIFTAAEDPNSLDLLIDELEGSIAFVADISTGSRDFGPVPLENMYPLSGLHSNIANSILQQDFLYELDTGGEMLLNLVFCLLLFLAAVRLRGTGFTFSGLLLLTLFISGAVLAFFYQNMLVNVVRTSLGILISLTVLNIYKYLLQENERAFIRARFENYLAPEILKKILKSPENIAVVQRKKLTILFSDIAGFTAWSSTKDPEEIHQTLNEYFEEMAKIVFAHGGTIDKYIGDGLLVFFGDPIEQEDHVLRAVKAAIDMQKKAAELNNRWAKDGGMELRIRVGINSGYVVVGNLGSEKRLDYTVIGANVNLAQRLESNAPVGGILVSAAVCQELDESVQVEAAGKIEAKGFEGLIEVFQVVV